MPNNNETYITGLRVVKGRKKSQCLNLSNARIKSYAEIEEMTEDELQGVIICPDYPLEDGHLVPSSAIGYEEGTVEDALDELNAEVNKGYVEVTADGVKNVSQLLDSLYALIDFTKVTHKAILHPGLSYYYLDFWKEDNTEIRFSMGAADTSNFIVSSMLLKSSGSTYYYGNRTTNTDVGSTTVYSSGTKIRLYY